MRIIDWFWFKVLKRCFICHHKVTKHLEREEGEFGARLAEYYVWECNNDDCWKTGHLCDEDLYEYENY